MSTSVEFSDGNTVMETDVDGSQYISNICYNATIGDTVRKCFPWLRWFEGKVSPVEKNKVGKVFTIVYEDNTSEHWSIGKVFSSKELIPIGGLGFWFSQTFRESTRYFIANVVEILDSSNQVCKLCDRESKNYSLSEIESFYRIQLHNNNEHAVIMIGIIMTVVMRNLTLKVTPLVLIARQVTWNSKGTVF